MPYTIRYNARTAHLEGLTERTTGPATDNSATTGVVSYYAQSACAALTRSGHRMAAADEVDTLADALEALHYFAEARGLKVCANCDRAAIAELESAYDIAELEARSAYGQLEAATTTGNEHRIADLEARAERAADKYADLAAAIARCNIIGCEKDTEPGDSQCLTHIREHGRAIDYLEGHDARTCQRRALGEPCTACALLAADAASAIETKAAPGVVAMIDNRTADYPRGPVALPDHGWKPAPCGAAAVGTDYTPEPMARGCLARITHNAIGAACIRTGDHDTHRTATGIEWMSGKTRPTRCPADYCQDCEVHAAELVARFKAENTHDPVAVYNARRALYRTASDGYEEHGGEANRAAAAAAWDAFVSAARAAGKCTDFTCYADAEPGADRCQRHHQRVTACLDHTEPGHAIALIDGGHGRQDAPQAWLAHEGGSWLLVDDYDGDTLNVKGPDPERAVHAWAALLGLRIDALTVEVEYAGGPVSPPVRAPERPAAITLGWRMVGSDSAAHVFEAHGRAHDYRVLEHPDNAGASLRAVLRGTEVETYRRGYMTPVDARAAAQHYEARYGSVYVPVR